MCVKYCSVSVRIASRNLSSKPGKRPLSRATPTSLRSRSEEHTSELQSPCNLVCRLLLEKKKNNWRPAHLGRSFHLLYLFYLSHLSLIGLKDILSLVLPHACRTYSCDVACCTRHLFSCI